MDKLLKSPWFVKILSFLLAIMLYAVVGMGGNDNSGSPIFPNKDEPDQITKDVDIEYIYDKDKFILTGNPEVVKVTFEGSKNAISRFRLQRAPDIVVDLSEYDAGDYNLRLELSDIPEDITAQIPDRDVKVTLHKKVTKTFAVQIELLNTNKLPDGYIAEDPEFEVKEATITGAKEIVDTIAYVKGFVDIGGAKGDLIRDVELKAYNDDMGEVQIAVNPDTISVKIPISNPKRDVPITIKQEGSLPENLVLTSIKADIETATVYGPQEVLDTINEISIPVDLSAITEDKTITVKLEKPADTFNMEPKEVIIKIDVEEKEDIETITLKDVPITINGLAESRHATFITPQNGLFDLIVKGSKEDIQTLNKSDIMALVNIEDLNEGKHTVKIEVKGPDGYFYEQSISEALLNIETQTT